jgi:hypothetical protein
VVLALVLVALMEEMVVLVAAALEAVVVVHLKVAVILQALAHPKVIMVVMAEVLHTLAVEAAALAQLVHRVEGGRALGAMVLLIRLQVQQQGSYLAGSIT